MEMQWEPIIEHGVLSFQQVKKLYGYNKNEFKRQESSKFKNVPACYYCSVRASNDSIDYAEEYYKKNNYPVGYGLSARQNAYYNALAREKMTLSKLSDFISGSAKLNR